MKTYLFTTLLISLSLVCFVGLYGCSVKKHLNLPCLENAFDDDLHWRELGIGESKNIQTARTEAFTQAQHNLISHIVSTTQPKYKIVPKVQYNSTQHLYTLHNPTTGAELARVQLTIGDFVKICEKTCLYKDIYQVFIVLELNKNAVEILPPSE